jgi:hypothetical protein
MTQRAVAQQVGLNPKTVQRWPAAGAFPELPPRRKHSTYGRAKFDLLRQRVLYRSWI